MQNTHRSHALRGWVAACAAAIAGLALACGPAYRDVSYAPREPGDRPAVPQSSVATVAPGDAAFVAIGRLSFVTGSAEVAADACRKEAAARGGDGVSAPRLRSSPTAGAIEVECLVYRRITEEDATKTAPVPSPEPTAATIPEGKGWVCSETGSGVSGCARSEDGCAKVRDEAIKELDRGGKKERPSPCKKSSAAHCFTYVDRAQKRGEWLCAPTDKLCESSRNARSRSSDFEDVTPCRTIP
jgi:hypothetical protein